MSSDRKDVSSTNEEDDLDGLDDVLDEFTAKPQQSTSTSTDTTNEKASTSTSDSKPSTSSTATATATADTEDEDLDAEFDEEAFAKELEANMAALMKTFSGGDDSVPPSTQPSEKHAEHQANEIEMMRQFEAMMNEMGLGNENGILGGGGGAGAGPSSSSQPSPSNGSKSTPAPANYQEALKATMSRLKESDASASASASGNHNNPLAGMFPGLENDEEMKKLLATLSGGGEGGEDGESPEFAKMLENMMGELMGKEVLYEPMKELSQKYQPFLDNPPRPLSEEDKTRFQKQAKIVKEVVALFEDPKFDNGTEEEKRKLKNEVGEKMNEMQECGAPPDEVAGEMPEGMEGIPGLDGNPENCLVM